MSQPKLKDLCPQCTGLGHIPALSPYGGHEACPLCVGGSVVLHWADKGPASVSRIEAQTKQVKKELDAADSPPA